MDTRGWSRLLPLAALLGLLVLPAPAVGGYDIAHIVERSCEPGGPLIVTDDWKSSKDDDEVVTEPGEVIACPPAGPRDSFQLAAGPERIGRDAYVCTYVSLFGRDGADTCSGSGWASTAFLQPQLVVQPESGRLTLIGIVSEEIAEVGLASDEGRPQRPTVIPVGPEQASTVGATGAFGYFSVPATAGTLCTDEPPILQARNAAGRSVARGKVRASTRLLSAADRVPHSTGLSALCNERGGDGRAGSDLVADLIAAVRTLLRSLPPPGQISGPRALRSES